MYNRDKIMNIMHEIHEESKLIAPYVVIAQPRRDKSETPAQHFDGHLGVHVDLCAFSHGFVDVEKQKVDVARNYLIDAVIDSKAKYLFFIGEDTVVPYDSFMELHETAEQNPDAMVVGVYYFKMSKPMIMIREGDYARPADVTPGRVFEATQTGLDCALIPVEHLRKIKESDPEIPFCCIAAGIEGIPFIGEDNFFVHRWRKAGYRLLVNTDVQCLHVDLANGRYTAHESVNLDHYFTNIELTERLTLSDKKYIDSRGKRSFEQ
jgi:hypothetical protein